MKYRLMDVLACPYDKTFPLVLVALGEKEYPERKYEWNRRPFCEEYCSLRNINIKQYPNPQELPCDLCIKKEITEGILYCPKCGRWYPIKAEIPILLPDELRNKDEDKEFLQQIEDKLMRINPEIGNKVISEGKPVSLK